MRQGGVGQDESRQGDSSWQAGANWVLSMVDYAKNGDLPDIFVSMGCLVNSQIKSRQLTASLDVDDNMDPQVQSELLALMQERAVAAKCMQTRTRRHHNIPVAISGSET